MMNRCITRTVSPMTIGQRIWKCSPRANIRSSITLCAHGIPSLVDSCNAERKPEGSILAASDDRVAEAPRIRRRHRATHVVGVDTHWNGAYETGPARRRRDRDEPRADPARSDQGGRDSPPAVVGGAERVREISPRPAL